MPQPQAGQPSAQTAYPATMQLPQPASAPPAYTAPAMPYATTASVQLPTLMTYQTPMPQPKSMISPIQYAAAPVSQPLYLNTQSSARRKDEFNDFEKVVIKCGKKVGSVGKRAYRVAAEIVGARNGALATDLLARTVINGASGMSAEDAAAAAFASTARQTPAQGGSSMAQILATTLAQNGNAQQSISQSPDITQILAALLAQNGNAKQPMLQGPDIMQIIATALAQNGNAQQPAPVQAAPQNPDFMRLCAGFIERNGTEWPCYPTANDCTGSPARARPHTNAIECDSAEQPCHPAANTVQAVPQGPDFMQMLSNAVAQSIPSAQQQQQQQQQTLAFLSSMSGAPQKAFATDMWAGDASAAYPAQTQQYQQEESVFQQEESVFAAEEYYEADTCVDFTE
ncbi:hypothetical protein BD779DRAFT_1678256 [Infundibulicybe gibba]|nr:hypothetical protein BD779DRAFT_1678256 [Infundibulicybe gibba]